MIYLFKQIKYLWQRLIRGYSDYDLLNLDLTIAKFILPRLKTFGKTIDHYPASLPTEIIWADYIDDMIFTFEAKIKYFPDLPANEKELKRYRRGLVAFSRFYDYLWK